MPPLPPPTPHTSHSPHYPQCAALDQAVEVTRRDLQQLLPLAQCICKLKEAVQAVTAAAGHIPLPTALAEAAEVD
jgi:hypothetical protein